MIIAAMGNDTLITCLIVLKLKSLKRKGYVVSIVLCCFVCFRNNTLTFWDDKTRLASKKFKSFNSFNTSVLKQVEQVRLDKLLEYGLSQTPRYHLDLN